MKTLLDTSFLRHLEQINLFRLLIDFSDILRYEFVMPETVYNELDAKNIPPEVRELLEKGIIHIESCNKTEILLTRIKTLSLDDGELETICIVDKCKDRTFKEYLILTDDKLAQQSSRKLNMSSLDVLMFLFLSNNQGFLSKNQAKYSLKILEDSGYAIKKEVKADYLLRLQ